MVDIQKNQICFKFQKTSSRNYNVIEIKLHQRVVELEQHVIVVHFEV